MFNLFALPPPNPDLADKFRWAWGILCYVMGAEWRRRGVTPAMETAISLRLIGLIKRLNAVFAKWRAGTLRAARGRTSTSPRPSSQGREGGVKPCAWGMLPQRYGWLKTMLPGCVHDMNLYIPLLDDAEMKAIIAAAPQVGRILRPFCHIFGLPVPAELVLPKPARREPGLRPPSRLRARRTPQEIAKAAIEKALRTGKPVDPRKMSAAAFGCVLHMPRDEHCPPPEIGIRRQGVSEYAKDYVPPKD